MGRKGAPGKRGGGILLPGGEFLSSENHGRSRGNPQNLFRFCTTDVVGGSFARPRTTR